MLFQFRLGKIPVQVHASHLVIAALFAWTFAQGPEGGPPPGGLILAWVAIISLSVLVHELGHAVAALVFGYAPVIQLAGMGGNTRPNAGGPIPWWRDVLLTFAGPAFGGMLGLVCFAVFFRFPDRHSLIAQTIRMAGVVNFEWTVLNLLPVSPLDGGRIATTLCTRLFGRVGFLLAQILALLVCAAVLAYSLLIAPGAQILALMFAWFGITSIQLISAYLRGDAPAAAAQDPHILALGQAAALYREGKLEESRRLADAALDAELTPPVRSRFHYLLGWIALKDGHGRDALDHFAQVQGHRVEPQALAAGFSLVGDDARALTLWEHAARETKDPTILHEWAGALIRLGRVDEAKKLPGVDMTAAYGCAERVLFIRGDFEGAANAGLAALEASPSARRAYDTACAFARAGKPDDALRLLERAAALGYDDPGYAAADDDLSSLRQLPSFRAWLGQLRHATS